MRRRCGRCSRCSRSPLAFTFDRDLLSLQMVTFNATVIKDSSAIKTSKGVANQAEKQAETDNTLMLTIVQAGTMLTDVALFVDSDSNALAPDAKTERWGR